MTPELEAALKKAKEYVAGLSPEQKAEMMRGCLTLPIYCVSASKRSTKQDHEGEV
jgi:hypothetical protein